MVAAGTTTKPANASSFHSATAESTANPMETCLVADRALNRWRPSCQHSAMPARQSNVPATRTRVTASISGAPFPHGHGRHLVFRFLRAGIDVIGHDAVDEQLDVVERGEQHARPERVGHTRLPTDGAVPAGQGDDVPADDAQPGGVLLIDLDPGGTAGLAQLGDPSGHGARVPLLQ